MIVVDASAVIEMLLNTKVGTRISQRVLDEVETIHAPHLIDLEVAQVLRRYVISRDNELRARQAIEDLAGIRIFCYPHEPLLNRIWELRSNFTAYDAVYVALAEGLAAPLVTQDKRFAAAASKLISVEIH